jgi:bifunctional DNA-binding transcriptional regulator/antitoxin component of YhaV-PrlF toxin-antitoxin module
MGRVAVIEGDRITLPREFRKDAKVRKGDLLEYKVQAGALVLSKPTKVENPTKKLFGIASDVRGDLQGDALFLEETKAKLRRSK